MVDFSKLRMRTAEERAADEAAREKAEADARKQQTDAVDALNAIERGLNEWELKFVDSVTRQSDRGDALSPKQWAIVNRILEQHG